MKTTSNSRYGNSNMQWQIVRKLPETNSQQPPTADHNSLKLDKSISDAPPLIPRPHPFQQHSCPSAKRKSKIQTQAQNANESRRQKQRHGRHAL